LAETNKNKTGLSLWGALEAVNRGTDLLPEGQTPCSRFKQTGLSLRGALDTGTDLLLKGQTPADCHLEGQTCLHYPAVSV